MARKIKSFIFLDLETTGLQNSRPRTTELSMVSVNRFVMSSNPTTSLTANPRVKDKLTLCMDPEKPCLYATYSLTKLDNNVLVENEKLPLDKDAITLIKLFISRQSQPACLLAHNGANFDFPVLQTELMRFSEDSDLGLDVLCLDTKIAIIAILSLDELWPPRLPFVNPDTGSPYTSRPPMSLLYSLDFLHRHYFGRAVPDAHGAEPDAEALLRVFLAASSPDNALLDYADTHAVTLATVDPLYTPTPRKRPMRDETPSPGAARRRMFMTPPKSSTPQVAKQLESEDPLDFLISEIQCRSEDDIPLAVSIETETSRLVLASGAVDQPVPATENQTRSQGVYSESTENYSLPSDYGSRHSTQSNLINCHDDVDDYVITEFDSLDF